MTTRATPPPAQRAVAKSTPGASNVRRIAGSYGVTAVTAAAIVWLAMAGGGYGDVARHVAGMVVWLFAIGVLVVRGRAALPRGPALAVAVAIGALAAVTGLSLLWTESAGRSYAELTRVLMYLGVFCAVAAVAAGSPRRRDQLLEGLTLGAAAVVLVAVLSRLEPGLFPDQPLGRFAPEFRPRLAYPFGYWNALGSFAAIALVLLVNAASRGDRPIGYRAAATALLPVTGLALYLTFSRGGLLAAALGCAVLLALTPRRLAAAGAIALGVAGSLAIVLVVRSFAELNEGLIDEAAARAQGHWALAALLVVAGLVFVARVAAARAELGARVAAAIAAGGRRSTIAATVAAIALVAVGGWAVVTRADDFTDPVVVQGVVAPNLVENRLTSGSANGRYQFWQSSVDAWQDRPLGGHGAGTWEFWWRQHATINAPTRDSHSLFFDVLAELGSLGVVALAALFGLALWICFAAARNATRAARPPLAAIAAAASAWTFGAAVDWSWEFASLGAVLLALVAIAATARDEQVAGRGAGAGDRSRRWIAVPVALAACVVVAQAVALVSAWSLERSEDHVARGDLAAGQRAAERARAVTPWASEPYMQLALVHVRLGTYDRAIAEARRAVDREPTNWRTWLTLTRVEARSGRLGDAVAHVPNVARLAKGSPLVPTAQQLEDLATSKDLSLSPDTP